MFVRVLYRKKSSLLSCYNYGWTFASRSLGSAWDTVRIVGATKDIDYRIEEIFPTDYDYPK